MSNLDPVTLTVIQNGLIQVCNEMDLAFVRSAFSPVISEGMDRSDGIYDAVDGSLIAQGELGLPVFVGTMQFSTRAVIDRVKSHYAGKVDPGDVFIVNDPYLGGTHLMDVRFVKPFFYKGELFAWLANTGHWPDVGGMVPGGFSASATEVEQEGLRLPPVKFWKKGEMDQEILSIILSNIRIADQRIGDIKAQAAALATGEVRLTALIDRYGADMVRQAIAEMRHRAERQMRARIAAIPDGVYEGTSQVDSDGVVDEPLTIKMKITKKGEELAVRHDRLEPALPRADEQRHRHHQVGDLSRHQAHLPRRADQSPAPSSRCRIVEPEGTFLYARYPRPVSGCAAEVSQRIAEAVFAALTKAIPDLLFAAPAGTSGNLGVGGYDPERKRSYIMYLFTGGGYGGFQGGDGLQQRLLDHRHLQDAAGRGARAVLSGAVRGVLPARGLGRRRRVPRRLRHQLRDQAAPRRGARLDGDGSRPHRPAGRAGRRGGRRQHRAVSQGGKTYRPPHLSKDQDIEIGVATWCACRRRAAAASAIPPGASPRRSPATSRAATTARPRRARSSARGKPPNDARPAVHAVAAVLALAAARCAWRKSVWYAVRGADHCLHRRYAGRAGLQGDRRPSRRAARRSRHHSYSLDSGRLSFVAQTALYPADVDVRQPRRVLQAVLDERAQRLAGGKWSEVDWREVEGAPAVESIGRGGGRPCAAPARRAEGSALRLARLSRAPRRRYAARGRTFLRVPEVPVMSKPRIHVLALGGTIATGPTRRAPCRWASAPTISWRRCRCSARSPRSRPRRCRASAAIRCRSTRSMRSPRRSGRCRPTASS